MKENIVI